MLLNGTEISLKKRKTKNVNMVANDIKIFLKMKNKGLLNMETVIIECLK